MDENWEALIKEYEPFLNCRYVFNYTEYKFIGLIHASDDYYYGMVNTETGKLMMCSCVGSLEGHGFVKISEPEEPELFDFGE